MRSLCSPPPRRGSLLLWLFFTAGLALTASSLEVPLCLFKAILGLPCPACGLGHACREAMHLNFADSFRHHPLGIPAGLALGLAYAFLSVDVVAGRDVTLRFLSRPWPRWAQAAAIGLILGVWVWKMLI